MLDPDELELLDLKVGKDISTSSVNNFKNTPPYLTLQFIEHVLEIDNAAAKNAMRPWVTCLQFDRKNLQLLLAKLRIRLSQRPKFLRAKQTDILIDKIECYLAECKTDSDCIFAIQNAINKETERWFNWSGQAIAHLVSRHFQKQQGFSGVLASIFVTYRKLLHDWWDWLWRRFYKIDIDVELFEYGLETIAMQQRIEISDEALRLIFKEMKIPEHSILSQVLTPLEQKIQNHRLNTSDDWNALIVVLFDMAICDDGSRMNDICDLIAAKLEVELSKYDFSSCLEHVNFQKFMQRLTCIDWAKYFRNKSAHHISELSLRLNKMLQDKLYCYVQNEDVELSDIITCLNNLKQPPEDIREIELLVQSRIIRSLKENTLAEEILQNIMSRKPLLKIGGGCHLEFIEDDSLKSQLQENCLLCMKKHSFSGFNELAEFITNYDFQELCRSDDEYSEKVRAVFDMKACQLIRENLENDRIDLVEGWAEIDFIPEANLKISKLIEPIALDLLEHDLMTPAQAARVIDAFINDDLPTMNSNAIKLKHPLHKTLLEELEKIQEHPLESKLTPIVANKLRRYLTSEERLHFVDSIKESRQRGDWTSGECQYVDAFLALILNDDEVAREKDTMLLNACPKLFTVEAMLKKVFKQPFFSQTVEQHLATTEHIKRTFDLFDEIYAPIEERKSKWMSKLMVTFMGGVGFDLICALSRLDLSTMNRCKLSERYLNSYLSLINQAFMMLRSRLSPMRIYAHSIAANAITKNEIFLLARMQKNMAQLAHLLSVPELKPSLAVENSILELTETLNLSAINRYKQLAMVVRGAEIAFDEGKLNLLANESLCKMNAFESHLAKVITGLKVMTPDALLLSFLQEVSFFLQKPNALLCKFDPVIPEVIVSFDMMLLDKVVPGKNLLAREIWFNQFKQKILTGRFIQRTYEHYVRFLAVVYTYQDISAILYPFQLRMVDVLNAVDNLEEFNGLLNILHYLQFLMPEKLCLGHIAISPKMFTYSDIRDSKFYDFLHQTLLNNQEAVLAALAQIDDATLTEARIKDIYGYFELFINESDSEVIKIKSGKHVDRLIQLCVMKSHHSFGAEGTLLLIKLAELSCKLQRVTFEIQYAMPSVHRLLRFMEQGGIGDEQLSWDMIVIAHSKLMHEKIEVIASIFSRHGNKHRRQHLCQLIEGKRPHKWLNSFSTFFASSEAAEPADFQSPLKRLAEAYIEYWLCEVEFTKPFSQLCEKPGYSLCDHFYVLTESIKLLDQSSITAVCGKISDTLNMTVWDQDANSYGMQLLKYKQELGLNEIEVSSRDLMIHS